MGLYRESLQASAYLVMLWNECMNGSEMLNTVRLEVELQLTRE